MLALAADGSYKLNEYFGVQGKGEVNVGKVEGKADIKAVMFDESGKLKPEVKASAKAEAIAVEAKGSAGVSGGGVEVLHWFLDVHWNEDGSKIRDGNLLKVQNILKKERSQLNKRLQKDE